MDREFSDAIKGRRAQLETLLSVTVGRHDRIALCFSGGKESLLLADALRPWAGKVDLVHVDTGAEFPHMREFIARATRGFNLVRVPSDQPGHIARFGLPSRLIPVRSMPVVKAVAATLDRAKLAPDRAAKLDAVTNAPRLQDHHSCCAAVRQAPLDAYLMAHRYGLVIHGQRLSDGAPLRHAVPGELLLPLWDWSEAEVLAEILARGIELPSHYGEVVDSLDCWSCTAELNPARLAWMRKAYPEHAALLGQALGVIAAACSDGVEEMREAIASLDP